MVVGDGSGAVRLWNLATPNPAARDFSGLSGEIAALAVVDKSKALDAAHQPPAEKDKGLDVLAALADGSLAGWKADATGGQAGQLFGTGARAPTQRPGDFARGPGRGRG